MQLQRSLSSFTINLKVALNGYLSMLDVFSFTKISRPLFFLAVLAGLIAVSMYVLMLPSLEARQLTWEGALNRPTSYRHGPYEPTNLIYHIICRIYIGYRPTNLIYTISYRSRPTNLIASCKLVAFRPMWRQ